MRAGTILKLAAPGYVESQAEHLRSDLIDNLNVVLAAAHDFNEGLEKVKADEDLSPQGRSAAGVRVAAAAFATLNAMESTTIKRLADHAASIENAIVSKVTHRPTDPSERISHELHLQELRSQLRQLPMEQRTNVYRTATDPLVLAAIDTAPMTLSETRPDGSRRLEPFIEPADRTAAILARAELVDPTSAGKLCEVQSLRQVYTLAVNCVRKEILDDVPDAAAVSLTATF